MDLNKMYIEEDLFPREIALYEKRSYGLLFYNEEIEPLVALAMRGSSSNNTVSSTKSINKHQMTL